MTMPVSNKRINLRVRNVSIFNEENQFDLNNFSEGGWKVRNNTNTGWIVMNPDNTRVVNPEHDPDTHAEDDPDFPKYLMPE